MGLWNTTSSVNTCINDVWSCRSIAVRKALRCPSGSTQVEPFFASSGRYFLCLQRRGRSRHNLVSRSLIGKTMPGGRPTRRHTRSRRVGRTCCVACRLYVRRTRGVGGSVKFTVVFMPDKAIHPKVLRQQGAKRRGHGVRACAWRSVRGVCRRSLRGTFITVSDGCTPASSSASTPHLRTGSL